LNLPHRRRLPGNYKGPDVADAVPTDMEEDGEEETPGILALNKCVETMFGFEHSHL